MCGGWVEVRGREEFWPGVEWDCRDSSFVEFNCEGWCVEPTTSLIELPVDLLLFSGRWTSSPLSQILISIAQKINRNAQEQIHSL